MEVQVYDQMLIPMGETSINNLLLWKRVQDPCEGLDPIVTVLSFDLKKTWNFNEKTYVITPTDSTMCIGGKILIRCPFLDERFTIQIDGIVGDNVYEVDSVSRAFEFRKFSCKGGITIILSQWALQIFYPTSKNWTRETELRLIYPGSRYQ